MLFVSIWNLNAQTIAFADTNFRNYVKQKAPALLDINDKLDTVKAKNYSGDISCPNCNFQDVRELQYFHRVNLINCSFNNISQLPSLDSLTEIQFLWIHDNQLSDLPNLSNCKKLKILNFKQNVFTELPNLSNLTALEELDCSGNTIRSIDGISNLTNLKTLYAYSNNIAVLPNLEKLSKLTTFDLFNNKLAEFPDFSKNTSLTTVNLSENNLNSLMPLFFQTSFKEVNLLENNFTFADLYTLENFSGFDTIFTYDTQKPILLDTTLALTEGGKFFYNLGIDENEDSLVFNWYLDGKFVQSSTSPVYTIDTLKTSDSGEITCEISSTKDKFKTIKLSVSVGKLIVNPCLNIKSLSYSVLSNSCLLGANIKIQDDEIIAPNKPLNYQLNNFNQTKEYKSTAALFENVLPDQYSLKISDSNNCSSTVQDFIVISEPLNCTKSFTPNNDGVDDDFFIPINGEFSIYSKEGILVRNLVGPISWDGKNNSGLIVPVGLYIIFQDGKDYIEVVVLN